MTMNFGRFADVSNAVLAAGFFSAPVARCYGWDRISLASRCDTTSGRLHGLSFWMTEIGTSWYAGTWGGHVYRVPRAANVTEFAIEFLRTATEMMDFSSDLKQRFGLIELTEEELHQLMPNQMRIALGCDHGGFPLKQRIVSVVQAAGHEVVDCGTDSNCSVDYPDFALKVGRTILAGQAERGILLCGSGVGISVAANKIPGIRAGVCHDIYSAHQGVEHDDMNVLCLGSRIVGEEVAVELVRAFINAQFTGEERHVRRLNKVLDIERDALAGKFATG